MAWKRGFAAFHPEANGPDCRQWWPFFCYEHFTILMKREAKELKRVQLVSIPYICGNLSGRVDDYQSEGEEYAEIRCI